MALQRLIVAGLCFLLINLSSLQAQVEYGDAAYYADKYHLSSKTASGELYDKYKFTAAHRSLKFGTILKVTHLENGRSVTVKVNDRGPYTKGRIIDLSRAAAEQIDLIEDGIAKVKIEVMVDGKVPSASRSARREQQTASSRPESFVLSTGRELDEPKPQHGDLSKLPLRDHRGALINAERPASSGATYPERRSTSNPQMSMAGISPDARVGGTTMAEAEKFTPTIFRMIAIKDNSGGFAVQLGAFNSYYRLLEGLNKINVKGIDNTLVQSGMKDGKPIFRILAGPYRSRAEAEQARKSFKRQNLKGITVNLSALN